jgi:uncharacterized damage-inducible protein DinB
MGEMTEALLDRLIGHDAWTTQQLLLLCQPLTDAQLDRQFDIDHGSLRELLQHMIGNMEVWTALMRGLPVERTDRTARPSVEQFMARHAAACAEFAALAVDSARSGRLNDYWIDRLDDPPTEKTYAGAILHVITHDMHHRAHLLFILRQLGLSDLPEGDLLGWEQQARR